MWLPWPKIFDHDTFLKIDFFLTRTCDLMNFSFLQYSFRAHLTKFMDILVEWNCVEGNDRKLGVRWYVLTYMAAAFPQKYLCEHTCATYLQGWRNRLGLGLLAPPPTTTTHTHFWCFDIIVLQPLFEKGLSKWNAPLLLYDSHRPWFRYLKSCII